MLQETVLFRNRVSIRSKILLPFIFIIIFLAITTLLLFVQLIPQAIERQLLEDYGKHSHLARQYLEGVQRRCGFYAQLIRDLNLSSGYYSQGLGAVAFQRTVSAFGQQDNVRVYWDARELGPEKQQLYGRLFADGASSAVTTSWFVWENDKKVVQASVASAIVVDHRPVVVEIELIPAFLMEFKHRYDVDVAYMAYDPENGDTQPKLFLGTSAIAENPSMKALLKKELTQIWNKSDPYFVGNLPLRPSAYKVIFEPISSRPQLYSATLVPLDRIRASIRHILFGTISILVLISFGIFLVYSVIIRKITSSIDILASVAEKVSRGDLDQHIFVSTQDEIGDLSSVFNQMISNLKESSSKLLREKNQSEAIISNIPEGIIVTDRQNQMILANQRAEEILEDTKNHDLLNVLKETIWDSEKPVTREIRLSNTVYFLTSIMVTIGAIHVLRDVTHEKELEALRDSFLRTVSHELRTPLTSIIGFIDLILGGQVTDDQRKYLKIALDESMNLKTLIDDLLDLSRIEAGKMDMVYSTLNIKGFLDQLVSLLLPLARGKQLELVSDVHDASVEVKVDAAKLRRIMVNLITNAIKFTEKGRVTLSCTVDSRNVTFQIADTGIGLMPHEKEVIFERFRQVDYSATRQYEGIGLGLSIVKELVEMHGGKIWVESDYGKGAVFYFTVPQKNL